MPPVWASQGPRLRGEGWEEEGNLGLFSLPEEDLRTAGKRNDLRKSNRVLVFFQHRHQGSGQDEAICALPTPL